MRNKPRALARKLHGDYWIDQPTLHAAFARALILISCGALFGFCFAQTI